MSRSDEVREVADWFTGDQPADDPKNVTAFYDALAYLRDYADLLDAAEELLRLVDQEIAQEGPAWISAFDPAWERLRKAARGA